MQVYADLINELTKMQTINQLKILCNQMRVPIKNTEMQSVQLSCHALTPTPSYTHELGVRNIEDFLYNF